MRTPRSFSLMLLCAFSGTGCRDEASDRAPGDTEAEAPAPIVEETPGYYQDVSWSPDGGRLAISVLEPADTPEGFSYRVFVLELDGSEYRAVTAGPMDYWVSWSPDGSPIAFSGTDGDNVDIYVVEPDGTQRRRLTDDAAVDIQPAWSPDGDRIAFVSDRGGREELFVMDRDGGAPTRIFGSSRHVQNPMWAGDGRSLAVFLTDGETDSVAVVGADGRGPRVLAAGVWPSFTSRGILFGAGDSLWLLPSGAAEGDLELVQPGADFGRISPDGAWLAFVATDAENVSVLVRPLAGGDSRVLLRRPKPPFF